MWTKLLPGFKWNKNSATKFKQVLNTPKFCSIIEKFNKSEFTHDYKGAENASDKLSSILLEAAKTSGRYKSNLPKNRNLKNKKWFDRDCSDKGKQFRHIADLNTKTLRTCHYVQNIIKLIKNSKIHVY